MRMHTNTKKTLILAALTAASMGVCGQITALMTSDAEFNYIGGTASHQVVDSIVGYGTYPDGEEKVVTRQTKKRDSMGYITEETSWVVNTEGKMLPSVRKLNKLDKKGRPTESIFSSWDDDVESFMEYMKYEYKYADNGICVIKKYFQDDDDNWITNDSTRLQATYNSNMDPVEITIEDWSNGEWKLQKKETYTYDEKNRITGAEIFNWSNTSWSINAKQSMNYSGESNEAEVTDQYWDGESWKDMSHSVGRTTLKKMRRVLYTSILTKKITKADEEKPKKKQGFYINTGEEKAYVAIYNELGKLMDKEKVSGTEFINLGKYGKGIYTIKVTQGERSVSRKIKIN